MWTEKLLSVKNGLRRPRESGLAPEFLAYQVNVILMRNHPGKALTILLASDSEPKHVGTLVMWAAKLS